MQVVGYETIDLAVDGSLATLTLNRPEVLNAFNAQMRRELLAALAAIRRQPAVKALIVTGAGRAFSAGGDIKELVTVTDPALLKERIQLMHDVVVSVYTLDRPVIAAVNGVAAGAGCALALASDVVIADAQATFSQAFVHIGLGPDSGGSYLLPLLVGALRAKEWLLTGAPIGARQAYEFGLVNRVVESGQALAEAVAFGRELAGRSGEAMAAIKGLVNRHALPNLKAALDAEAESQLALLQSPSHREALQAMLDRRRRKDG